MLVVDVMIVKRGRLMVLDVPLMSETAREEVWIEKGEEEEVIGRRGRTGTIGAVWIVIIEIVRGVEVEIEVVVGMEVEEILSDAK